MALTSQYLRFNRKQCARCFPRHGNEVRTHEARPHEAATSGTGVYGVATLEPKLGPRTLQFFRQTADPVTRAARHTLNGGKHREDPGPWRRQQRDSPERSVRAHAVCLLNSQTGAVCCGLAPAARLAPCTTRHQPGGRLCPLSPTDNTTVTLSERTDAVTCSALLDPLQSMFWL